MTEPIFKEEEKAILLSVDKAKASSNNSQTIGINGEKPLIDFLNNYLPPTLKAVSGHFLTPNKIKSPQIDIMIVDTRYPLLGYNTDGTTLVMGHSVLKVIEIKTNLTRKDILKTTENFLKIRHLITEIWPEGENYDWSKPVLQLIAYRISIKLASIEKAFFEFCDPENNHFDVTILRSNKENEFGTELHFEPTSNWSDFVNSNYEEYKHQMKGKYLYGSFSQKTPLSDFYYNLIQNSYYIVDHRGYSLTDIGAHFMEYLNWSTLLKN